VTRLRWIAIGVAAFVGGVALGTAGVVVQADRSSMLDRDLPWGLVLTLATVAIAVRGACWWARSRAAGAVVTIGWVVATLVLGTENAAGDILLPDDLRSKVYLVGGVALALLASAWPLPPRSPAARPDPGPGAVRAGSPGDAPLPTGPSEDAGEPSATGDGGR
jgi:hypothetical protein